MAGYREPGFQERTAAAAKAREAALAKLKAKAPIDPAERERRIAEARLRDQAATEKRNAQRVAQEAKKEADRIAKAAAAEAAAAKAVEEAAMAEQRAAERKAARDAKYAARKARSGGR